MKVIVVSQVKALYLAGCQVNNHGAIPGHVVKRQGSKDEF
jgi:hypothetical protein